MVLVFFFTHKWRVLSSAEWFKIRGQYYILFLIFAIKLNRGSFPLVDDSLVSETIPRHRDYRSSPQGKKEALRKVSFHLFFG